jgi:hypothetical protein
MLFNNTKITKKNTKEKVDIKQQLEEIKTKSIEYFASLNVAQRVNALVISLVLLCTVFGSLTALTYLPNVLNDKTATAAPLCPGGYTSISATICRSTQPYIGNKCFDKQLPAGAGGQCTYNQGIITPCGLGNNTAIITSPAGNLCVMDDYKDYFTSNYCVRSEIKFQQLGIGSGASSNATILDNIMNWPTADAYGGFDKLCFNYVGACAGFYRVIADRATKINDLGLYEDTGETLSYVCGDQRLISGATFGTNPFAVRARHGTGDNSKCISGETQAAFLWNGKAYNNERTSVCVQSNFAPSLPYCSPYFTQDATNPDVNKKCYRDVAPQGFICPAGQLLSNPATDSCTPCPNSQCSIESSYIKYLNNGSTTEASEITAAQGSIVTARVYYDNQTASAINNASIKTALPQGFTYLPGSFSHCKVPSLAEKVCDTQTADTKNDMFGVMLSSGISPNATFYDGTNGTPTAPGSVAVGSLPLSTSGKYDMGKKKNLNINSCHYRDSVTARTFDLLLKSSSGNEFGGLGTDASNGDGSFDCGPGSGTQDLDAATTPNFQTYPLFNKLNLKFTQCNFKLPVFPATTPGTTSQNILTVYTDKDPMYSTDTNTNNLLTPPTGTGTCPSTGAPEGSVWDTYVFNNVNLIGNRYFNIKECIRKTNALGETVNSGFPTNFGNETSVSKDTPISSAASCAVVDGQSYTTQSALSSFRAIDLLDINRAKGYYEFKMSVPTTGTLPKYIQTPIFTGTRDIGGAAVTPVITPGIINTNGTAPNVVTPASIQPGFCNPDPVAQGSVVDCNFPLVGSTSGYVLATNGFTAFIRNGSGGTTVPQADITTFSEPCVVLGNELRCNNMMIPASQTIGLREIGIAASGDNYYAQRGVLNITAPGAIVSPSVLTINGPNIGTGICSPDPVAKGATTNCRFPLTGSTTGYQLSPSGANATIVNGAAVNIVDPANITSTSGSCLVISSELVCNNLPIPAAQAVGSTQVGVTVNGYNYYGNKSIVNVVNPTATSCANGATNNPACNQCNSGQFFDTSCKQCTAGYTCAGGAAQPQACNAGTYCPAGSTNAQSCSAGYYCGATAGSATICTAGNFCGAGSSAPNPCSAGTYCPSGSATPTTCLPKNYCGANASALTPCGVGQTSPAGSSTIDDCITTNAACTNGATNAGTCNLCPLGNYYNSSTTLCTQCPAGSTCAGAAAQPVGCLAGTYCPTGSVNSIPCSAGYFCGVGAGTASICTAGNYCLAGSSTPSPCPAGTYCQTGSVNSTICLPGSFCTQGSSTQTPCTPGNYCPTAGGTAQSACASGQTSPQGSTSNSACIICPAGSICVNGTAPSPCPANNFCIAGSTAPAPCPDSGTSLASSQSQTACKPTTCPVAQYLISESCLPCPSGKTCPGGTAQPATCDSPKVVSANTCITPEVSCTAGQYLTTTVCKPCPSAATCAGGTTQPVCQSGSLVDGACSQGNNNLTCTSTQYKLSGSCTACPPNNYCDGSSAIPCTTPNTLSNNVCTAPTNVSNIGTSIATTAIPLGSTIGSAAPIIPLSNNTFPNGTVATFTLAGSTSPITGTIVNGSFVPTAGQTIPSGATTGPANGTLSVSGQTLSIPTNFSPASGTNNVGTVSTPITGTQGNAVPNVTITGNTSTNGTTATLTLPGTTTPITGTITNGVFTPNANQTIPTGTTTGPGTAILIIDNKIIAVPVNIDPAPNTAPIIGTTTITTTNPIGGSIGSQSPVIPLVGNNSPNGTVATFTPTGVTTPITGTIINGNFIPNIGQTIPTGTTTGPSTGTLKIGNQTLIVPTNFIAVQTVPTSGGGGGASITICSGNCGSTSTANTTSSTSNSSTSSSSSISTSSSQIVANVATSAGGVFKSKLRITDPYVCGEGSYGNVPNPKEFGVDFVYYDFYKTGTTTPLYSFKLKIANNGDFFLPISKSTNVIKEGDYKVVFYAYDSEGNKAQGDYTDFITDNCANSKAIQSAKANLPRTGGLEIFSIFVFISSLISAVYFYKKSTYKKKFGLKM